MSYAPRTECQILNIKGTKMPGHTNFKHQTYKAVSSPTKQALNNLRMKIVLAIASLFGVDVKIREAWLFAKVYGWDFPETKSKGASNAS
jgi:hypothetical protein